MFNFLSLFPMLTPEERGSVTDTYDRKAAKNNIRLGSFSHESYPDAGPKPWYVYWKGLEKILQAHDFYVQDHRGRAVILYGLPGSGKTSSMEALIHGNTMLRPPRALMIRFYAVAGASEQQVLNEIAKLLRFPHFDDADRNELATFVVDAVTKGTKPWVMAVQNIQQNVVNFSLDMCGPQAREKVVRGSVAIEELPEKWLPEKKVGGPKQDLGWPVIVFDDVNGELEKGGLLGSFFYSVANHAASKKVIFYITTKERKTAYQLWQLNGGNFLHSHPAVIEPILKDDKPRDIEAWQSKFEKELEVGHLESLKKERVPTFFFKKHPFVFEADDAKEFLWNFFSARITQTEAQAEKLRRDSDKALAEKSSLGDMIVHMEGEGYPRYPRASHA